ncbi:MAG: hypothetical protein PHN82_02120 [bacterium]|nr:hypothetical protein [bacterium]
MAARKDACTEMPLREIEQRASLLFGLRYGKRRARERILQNIRWEFGHAPSAALERRIEEIIDHAYQQ